MAEKTNTSGTALSTAGSGGKPGANGSSKMDMVRKALAKYGKDAKPTQIQDYVKKEFGVEMTADHVSNYKGKILRGEGGRKKAKSKRKAARPKAQAPKMAAAKPAMASLSLKDVETTRALLGRIGPAQLRGLIELLD